MLISFVVVEKFDFIGELQAWSAAIWRGSRQIAAGKIGLDIVFPGAAECSLETSKPGPRHTLPLLRSCRLVVTNDNFDAYNHRD